MRTLAPSSVTTAAAAAPRWGSGVLSVDASSSAGLKVQRSEVIWGTGRRAPIALRPGDVLTADFVAQVDLGAATADRGEWSVVFQLIGPARTGGWPAPPLTLHIRDNSWRIGGGAGISGGTKAAYAPNHPAFHNGIAVHWRFAVVVSSNPGSDRVDAWLNGRHVVTAWHPPAGTIYPTQDHLLIKSGLYTGGTDSQPIMAADRHVRISDIYLKVRRANQETVYH